MKRRKFLSSLSGLIIFLVGGKLIFEFMRFRVKKSHKIRILEDEMTGKPKIRDGVIFFRDQDGLHLLSARCTHLGCIVEYDEKTGIFRCPCHGSEYVKDGSVIKGPARKRLKKLDYILDENIIWAIGD